MKAPSRCPCSSPPWPQPQPRTPPHPPSRRRAPQRWKPYCPADCSNFSEAEAIDALQAAGLAKKPGGTFEPEDKPVALFGGTVTSADVNVAEGERSLFVYLNGVGAKRLAKAGR